MKIHHYKNGKIAFWEFGERHLITEAEEKALVIDRFTTTVLAFCIKKKIDNNEYKFVPFTKILDEYRTGRYSVERKTTDMKDIQIVRDNSEVIAIALSDGEGENHLYMSDHPQFEDVKKEML